MTQERKKTIQALTIAIQMESDGKEFYLRASQNSKNEMGQKLLESLSSEEDYHKQKFEKIFAAIQAEKDWPEVDFTPDGGKNLRTVFSTEMQKSATQKESIQTEIETVQKAMDMESESREFYKKCIEEADEPAEKQFYSLVADEEREHFLVLLDYFEYLKDPAAWFIEKEHPSLDGG